MLILGIDPGKTTGWVLYDSVGHVVDRGNFAGAEVAGMPWDVDVVVVERTVAYGPTRPEAVESAYVCGRLTEHCLGHLGKRRVSELTRLEVKQLLTDATLGDIRAKNDATCKAALTLLHGTGSADKPKTRKGKVITPGGVLGSLQGSHEWAALAVAYAYWLTVRPK